MKKRLAVSLLLGFLFLVISLGYKTGKGPEPMPYINNGGYEINNGLVAQQKYEPNEPSLAERGWPMAIVSISPDEDAPNNYYKALIIKNTLVDYLIFAGVTFLILSVVAKLSTSKK
jgi:hypothetical protein